MNQRNKYNLVTIICPILMVMFSELSFEVSEKFIPMIYVILIICVYIRHMIKCPNCNYKTGKGFYKFGNFSVIWWKLFAPKKCIHCGFEYNEKIMKTHKKNPIIRKYKIEHNNIVIGMLISIFSIASIIVSFLGTKYSNSFVKISLLWNKYMPFLFVIGLIFLVMGYVLKYTKNTSLHIISLVIVIFNSVILILWYLLYILDSKKIFFEIINGMRFIKIPIGAESMFILFSITMAVFVMIPFISNTIIMISQIVDKNRK